MSCILPIPHYSPKTPQETAKVITRGFFPILAGHGRQGEPCACCVPGPRQGDQNLHLGDLRSRRRSDARQDLILSSSLSGSSRCVDPEDPRQIDLRQQLP